MGKRVVSGGVRSAPLQGPCFWISLSAAKCWPGCAWPPEGQQCRPPALNYRPSQPGRALEMISEAVSKQTYQYPWLNR